MKELKAPFLIALILIAIVAGIAISFYTAASRQMDEGAEQNSTSAVTLSSSASAATVTSVATATSTSSTSSAEVVTRTPVQWKEDVVLSEKSSFPLRATEANSVRNPDTVYAVVNKGSLELEEEAKLGQGKQGNDQYALIEASNYALVIYPPREGFPALIEQSKVSTKTIVNAASGKKLKRIEMLPTIQPTDIRLFGAGTFSNWVSYWLEGGQIPCEQVSSMYYPNVRAQCDTGIAISRLPIFKVSANGRTLNTEILCGYSTPTGLERCDELAAGVKLSLEVR